MAKIEQQSQGVIDISNVQGNYLEVPMEFSNEGTPIDLTSFSDIRLEIKTEFNVNETAFLTFTVGSGLTISGDNNNILTFVLDEIFWTSQRRIWVYDIVFETSTGERYTYIKGTIRNNLTASKT